MVPRARIRAHGAMQEGGSGADDGTWRTPGCCGRSPRLRSFSAVSFCCQLLFALTWTSLSVSMSAEPDCEMVVVARAQDSLLLFGRDQRCC